MATIKDVARLANVSVATVSRVLNGTVFVREPLRQAVLEAQRQLGFSLNVNARDLALKVSRTVGVLVSDVSDPYFGILASACESISVQRKQSMLVAQGYHNAEQERAALENLIAHRCSALVVHAMALSDQTLQECMDKVPSMVVINRVLPGYESRCVNVDNQSGMREAVKHLLDCGHTRIAFIDSSHGILDAVERYRAYEDMLREQGCPADPQLRITVDPTMEGGRRAALRLLEQRGRFSAVAAYNDQVAAGLIAQFREAGLRVPDDISVTGFDDLGLAGCLNPPLTTVKNPVREMARYATELSLSLYAKEDCGPPPPLLTTLVIRESVRNLGAGEYEFFHTQP